METLLMLSHAASEFRKEGNCINLFGNKLGIVQGTQVSHSRELSSSFDILP